MSYVMKEETKTGGTKRRAYTQPYTVTPSSRMIMRRVNRISRKMKIHNPNHMYTANLASLFPSVSTTGSLYDVMDNVQQGTSYNDRFAAKVQIKRIVIRGIIKPGTTSAAPATVRITCIRGMSGRWLSSDCPMS